MRQAFFGILLVLLSFYTSAVSAQENVIVAGLVEDRVLQSAIDEAKAIANLTKPISHADVVDLQFSPRGDQKINLGEGFKPAPTGWRLSSQQAATTRLLHRVGRQGKIEDPIG